MYIIAATWKFALPYLASLQADMINGLSAEDAAEKIVVAVEDDPLERTVGANGFPNSMGEVELDASFMEGHALRIGAVGGLSGFRNPVRVARRVMTDTPYNLLVGSAAGDFALSCGFKREFLLSEDAHKAYIKHLSESSQLQSHDTVGVIVLDTSGHFAVATSTSGLAYKLPGRVSDSALCGCGFYADDEIGAAVATGVGEDIMRGTLCASAMCLLRDGYSPQEAANEAIRRLVKRLGRKYLGDDLPQIMDSASDAGLGRIALIVVGTKGDYGFAANHDMFSACIATDSIEASCIPFTTPIIG